MIYRNLPSCDRVVRERCLLALRDENVVISARVRAADLPDYERLNPSIHCALNGAEAFFLDRRRVAVDDDSYLLINGGSPYGSRIANAMKPLHSFSVHFRRGLAEEALRAMTHDVEAALDDVAPTGAAPVEFIEQLTPHNGIVSPALRQLMCDIEDGEGDREWLEEQCAALLARVLRWHQHIGAIPEALPAVRLLARREIERRIGRATDLMLTHYAMPLTLERMAAEACLSRFHFVRLFRAVHQVTPYAFLQRKRCAVAARLLMSTELPLEAVAEAVGIASRVTLFRLVRKHTRVSPTALRGGMDLSRSFRSASTS